MHDQDCSPGFSIFKMPLVKSMLWLNHCLYRYTILSYYNWLQSNAVLLMNNKMLFPSHFDIPAKEFRRLSSQKCLSGFFNLTVSKRNPYIKVQTAISPNLSQACE